MAQFQHYLTKLEAKKKADARARAATDEKGKEAGGISALSEEMRAKLIAELIDEDVDKKSKKTQKKRGK